MGCSSPLRLGMLRVMRRLVFLWCYCQQSVPSPLACGCDSRTRFGVSRQGRLVSVVYFLLGSLGGQRYRIGPLQGSTARLVAKSKSVLCTLLLHLCSAGGMGRQIGCQ